MSANGPNEWPEGVSRRPGADSWIFAVVLGWICSALLGAAFYPSPWIYAALAYCVLAPLLVYWRFRWFEKHGWYKRLDVVAPTLPFTLKQPAYTATFEFNRIIYYGGVLYRRPKEVFYSEIRWVTLGFNQGSPNAILVSTLENQPFQSEKNYLWLGSMSRKRQMELIKLLAEQAPEAVFLYGAAMMKEGWARRL